MSHVSIDNQNSRIVIVGAGSIGCWIGGALIHAGRNVAFLGRPPIAQEIRENGLRLTDHEGRDIHLSPDEVDIHLDPDVLSDADIVIVAVKSPATDEVASTILARANPRATVLSFQNGVKNPGRLRAVLGEHADVRAAMVPFNVVGCGAGHFHRGVEGNLVLEQGPTDLAPVFTLDGLTTLTSADIQNVLWGKILLNLNNALNALSGIPLKQQLSHRGWRRILASCQAEALAVMKVAGIKPHSELPVPMTFMPAILRLPDFLFTRVASKMLAIDECARSSMWEDLSRHRSTEIHDLQGEIIALANQCGVSTPCNRRVLKLIVEAQQMKTGSPGLKPEQVMS